jgi:hypothetical protein
MTFIHGQALSAEELERALSRELTPQRFASLCNALAWLTAGRTLESVPSFTERVNVRDKGIDAQLELEMPRNLPSASPYLGPGLNILQFKQRDIFAQGRPKTVANLKSDLKGALKDLAARTGSHPDRYSVFTNIDLSHEQKRAFKKAVAHGYTRAKDTHVEIVGAGELVAAVNGLPHVRSGYFATGSFSSWQEAKRRHSETKVFGGAVNLIGRSEELASLKSLLDQPDVRAVVLTGPHNIGKSRLALEATQHRFLDAVVALGGRTTTPADLATMVTPGRATVIIVEDLDLRDLERLVDYVLGAPELKLIATLPLAEGNPDPNLGRDRRVRVMLVRPLTDSASHDLLRAAGARFDFGMEAWVVDQAGGNPGILLAAARAGTELRRTTAEFADDVARAFTRRARAELGEQALDALEVLSLMTHVGISAEAGKELTLVSKLFGGDLGEKAIVKLLSRLQESGVLKVAGPFAEVTPPFFANDLARARLRGRDAELMQLFAGLNSAGRYRLLRRLQSVRSEEAERFWAGLAGPDGPLRDLRTALETPHLLRIVATAAPERAAAIIEQGLNAMSREERGAIRGEKRREIMWALDELLFREETSSRALRSLVRLAEAENEGHDNNATGVFGEAFHWNHPQLPLPLEERLGILRECTAEGTPRERQLVAIQAIETGLRQGGSVTLRRGGGGVPLDAQPRMTWPEVWDFNEALFDELMALARSADDVVAAAALAAVPTALQSVGTQGRSAKVMARIREVARWALEEGAPVSIAKLIGTLRFVRARLARDAQRPGASNVDELRATTKELEELLTQLQTGNFGLRLKRWAGPWAWGDHEEDDQGRRGRERWDDELHSLGREAVEDPTRLTAELREWLISSEAQRAYRFFYWLGRSDDSRRWLATMEEWGKGAGGGPLASYLAGLGANDPGFVSGTLDELASRGEVSGRTLVSATSSLPPDEAGLGRVGTLLAEGRVDPEFTATALSGGRWAEPLTDHQFLGLLRAIAGPDLRHAVPVVDFLGMWRHLGRRIDGSLAEFAWRCLESAPTVTPNETYDFDQLAAALIQEDPDRAFRLLEALLTQPRERGSWRPTDRYQEGEFWTALRQLDRERALRLVFGVAARHDIARLEITWDLRESLDQVQDGDILAALAVESERQAELVTEALTTAKTGFWPIALKIAEKYPRQRRVLGNLAAGIEQVGSMIQGPWSAHLERCRAEVRDVIEREGVSSRVANWLRGLEASLAKQARSRLMAEAAEDVNELRRVVENPAAPERLWAIRSLVSAKRTSVLRELLDREELRQLIPRLGLSAMERDRLRRELGLSVQRGAERSGARKKGRRRPRR